MLKKWPYLILLLVCGFTLFHFYNKYTQAPHLQLSSLQLRQLDGNRFNWEGIRGDRTLLLFSASWCGACREGLREISGLPEDERNDLKIVVISDESPEEIARYRRSYDSSFVFLKSEQSFTELKIHSVPTSFLLNRDLVTVKEKVGNFNWTDPSTRQHLLTLMD